MISAFVGGLAIALSCLISGEISGRLQVAVGSGPPQSVLNANPNKPVKDECGEVTTNGPELR